MPQIYHSHTLLSVSALIIIVTHALAVPTLADVTHYTSLPQSNATTTSSVATAPPHNITHSPLTFLGVNCYHLLPDTVDLTSCQSVFANMLREGNIYEQHNWWNGWQFRTGRRGPCTITLSSAAPEDHFRMVRVSIAEVMMYATEVLQSCRETRTGGANTFEGSWKVEVTKYPLERAALE